MKQVKEEIVHTISAYLEKDEAGDYKIPTIRQRPILLMGPPGVGKTQIMEQIARECKILLVSYTMTHHTRQSAVGLPMIQEKVFQGSSYAVTEYTMSEIIASIYQKMEETGLREGILFIDEINCVSETLAPTMLQFLQCKTFGGQAVPEGWLIVAAGNPPEYNKSVREFDMVTLDRVRILSVEADESVWREYARNQKVHGAILSYLELKPNNFYRVEADVDGMQYVTARGWEDFSCLLFAYEARKLKVTPEIVYEYLHHKDIAEDVAAYLDLYRKYQDDYGIEDILLGKGNPEAFARILRAGFDERLSVTNLLIDGLLTRFQKVLQEKEITDRYFAFLKSYRQSAEQSASPVLEYEAGILKTEELLAKKERDGFYGREEKLLNRRFVSLLKDGKPLDASFSKEEAFAFARERFMEQRRKLEALEEAAKASLEAAFDFMEEAFGRGEEMVVFVTELTIGRDAAAFLAEYGCQRYLLYHQELLIGSRKRKLLSELEMQK